MISKQGALSGAACRWLESTEPRGPNVRASHYSSTQLRTLMDAMSLVEAQEYAPFSRLHRAWEARCCLTSLTHIGAAGLSTACIAETPGRQCDRPRHRKWPHPHTNTVLQTSLATTARVLRCTCSVSGCGGHGGHKNTAYHSSQAVDVNRTMALFQTLVCLLPQHEILVT